MRTRELNARAAEPWQSIAQIPRDGTPVFVIHDDFSGVEVIAFNPETDEWIHFSGGWNKDGAALWEDGEKPDRYWAWAYLPQPMLEKLTAFTLPNIRLRDLCCVPLPSHHTKSSN